MKDKEPTEELVVVDVSRFRKVKNALKDSEARYRLLFENMPIGIFRFSADGKILDANPALLKMLGYSSSAEAEQKNQGKKNKNILEILREFCNKIESQNEFRRFDLTWRKKDNTPLFIRVNARIVSASDNNVLFYEGTVENISERKRAESQREAALEALRESEDKYKSLVDNIPDIIFTIDLEGKITFVSRRIKEILGYENAETINMYIFNFIPEKDRQRAMENLQKGMKGEKIKHFQMPMIAKSGKRLFFECSFSRVYKDGAVIGAQGTAVDITECKQAESQKEAALNALIESEEKYSTLVEQARDGVIIVQDKLIKFANRCMAEMSGYTVKELTGMSTFDLTPPAFVPILLKKFALHAKGADVADSINTQLLCKDGTVKEMESSLKLIRYAGKTAVLYLTRDISERKLAEIQIQYQANLLANVADAILATDRQFNIQYWNSAAEKQYGWTAAEVLGSHFLKFIQPKYNKYSRSTIIKKILQEGFWKGELLHNRRNGAFFPVQATISEVRNTENQIIGHITIIRDISELKQAEMNLQILSTRNQVMLEAIPDIIMEVDTNKVYTWANQAGIEFFGNAVIGKETSYYFEGEQQAYQAVIPIFEGHEDLIYVESWQRRRNGEKRLLAWWYRILKDEFGHMTGALASARDITEIKRIEEALRESEQKFRETIVNLDEGYYSVTPDGKLLEHNQAFCRILGFDLSKDLKGMQFSDFWQSPKEWHDYLLAFTANGSVSSYQINAKKQKGESITVLASAHLVKDENDIPQRIEGVFLNITERKQVESQREAALELLRDTLAGKEVLLKEVHHRVKNNLAAIIGLLQLQRETVTDPAAVAQFRELERRISSMVLVHETLYHIESLARIDLQKYLETLIAQLRAALDPRGDVRFNVTAAGVEMGLDNAVPCGLILNELITNAFKYAFPGNQPRPGEKACVITVAAEWDSGAKDGGVYTLTVADNGVGLPVDLDWATTKTLGLRLVRMLGQYQLKGQIELDRAAGTSFRLVFASRQN